MRQRDEVANVRALPPSLRASAMSCKAWKSLFAGLCLVGRAGIEPASLGLDVQALDGAAQFVGCDAVWSHTAKGSTPIRKPSLTRAQEWGKPTRSFAIFILGCAALFAATAAAIGPAHHHRSSGAAVGRRQ